jgi:dihydrofolate reductase
MSQDGFIADKDGGVSWLDKYNNGQEDCGSPEFYSSVDALVYGKNTYNQVLTFGPWPYPNKMSYIFGDKDTVVANKDVELVDSDIPTFIKKMDDLGIKRLWLMGGAKLVESFEKLGLIDEYVIAVIPEKLGEGIALPQNIVNAQNLKLIHSVNYPISNITINSYKK